MNESIAILRVVSMLRGLLRGEVQSCNAAIQAGDGSRARKEILEVTDKLKRAINVLNGLR